MDSSGQLFGAFDPVAATQNDVARTNNMMDPTQQQQSILLVNPNPGFNDANRMQQQFHQSYHHQQQQQRPRPPSPPGIHMGNVPLYHHDHSNVHVAIDPAPINEEDPVNIDMAVSNAVQQQIPIGPSEEETNVALAAMQEAASYVILDPEDPPALPGSNHISSKRKSSSIDSRSTASSEEETDSNGVTTRQSQQPKRKRSKSTTTTHRTSWEERIQQLTEYKAEHGDLLIPIRYKLNPSLGKFVHNTREQYKLFLRTKNGGKPPVAKKGKPAKKCSLTEERVQQLKGLGFVWSTERSKHQKEDWEARLQQLKEYKQKYGDCLVPHGYTEDPSFAEWIHRQRTTHAHMLKEAKPSPLVVERMQQLEEIGFHFTVHADKWMEHCNELREYKRKHGDCQVPTHCNENPQLGRWVHTQRHQRRLQLKGKKSCMTDERVAILDSLGFCWDVRHKGERPRATWQQRYIDLKQFVEEHDHFQIPESEYPLLRAWCQEQKEALTALYEQQHYASFASHDDISRRINDAHVKALEDIGFTKDVDLGEMPRQDLHRQVQNGYQPIMPAPSMAAITNEHRRTTQQHPGMPHPPAMLTQDMPVLDAQQASIQPQVQSLMEPTNVHELDHHDFGETLQNIMSIEQDHDHAEAHPQVYDGTGNPTTSPQPDRDCTIQATQHTHSTGGRSGDIFSPGMAMV